jgi:glycosyltransferase involved in cell wall biosynthesis
MTSDDALGPPAISKRILVLTPQYPYPPHQGTTLRNYNLIAGLAERHEVHLVSFGDPVQTRGTPLDDLCHSIQVVRPPRRVMSQRIKGVLFSRLPDMAGRLPSDQFRAIVADIVDSEHPHVVQVEGIELAQYLFQVADSRPGPGRPMLVFDDHNAEYVLQQRAFETDAQQLRLLGKLGAKALGRRLIGAVYSFVQYRRLQRYERRACLAADHVVAVSEADAEALRHLVPGLEPIVVPNGVDLAYCTSPAPSLEDGTGPNAEDLVFVGKMDFRPNVDAVLWFAHEVLPLIRRESPATRFWVVGKDPHPRLASLAGDPGVRLTGWVEDVRPYIDGAGVYVIPLRIGGGTRLKVPEAMAMGKAIVSTALGCEGFDLVPDRELVIADAPVEFASAVLFLLRDPERRERMGRAARRFAGARYDWRVIVPRLEHAYEL